ncbi:PREDICTED: uncharacterized protein LOC109126643 [Camelina sativa]|uniref:Uncharacterized protein LOC109126643 n=1 Tax=Camelina sativa TaxID=90675 RepID=A0ABM1QGP8_CAMSA|nr:PREDICTED: uncharacterized protein LOC109126643 [Camelina sativa]
MFFRSPFNVCVLLCLHICNREGLQGLHLWVLPFLQVLPCLQELLDLQAQHLQLKTTTLVESKRHYYVPTTPPSKKNQWRFMVRCRPLGLGKATTWDNSQAGNLFLRRGKLTGGNLLCKTSIGSQAG